MSNFAPLSRILSRNHAGVWDRALESHANNGFDVLRLVLAAFVVFTHSYFLVFDSPFLDPLYIFSRGHIDFGRIGVNGFFAVSGFLVTRSWLLTGDVRRYFQKRTARIYPAFLVAYAATVLIGVLSSKDIQASLSGIHVWRTIVSPLFLSTSGITGAFPNNPVGVVDTTFWTLKYEFYCYIALAMLGIAGLLTRPIVLLLFLTLVIPYVAQCAGYFTPPHWNYGITALLVPSPFHWPRFFSYFFAGSAFYLWRNVIPKSKVLVVLALLGTIASFHFGLAEPALITLGTYCLFAGALSVAAVLRVRGKRVDLSYGVFLFGILIQQLFIAWFSNSLSPLVLFIVAFPIACCVAYLSWRYIEAPSLRYSWPTDATLRKRFNLAGV
jgi:peptidoglycan/LPS O-acetylase OafA/YrhL